jgi:N-ethylmaleimide reductase
VNAIPHTERKKKIIMGKKLFSPVTIGAIPLSHRVVMAPLTRQRSSLPGDVPNDLMLEYYGQRASGGGLIITEATTVSITGRGYLGAPGIYSDEQVGGWKKITDAVHAKGGKMILQLWHVGRVSHVDMTGGVAPVGPSAIPFKGVAFTKNGWVPVSPNRALEPGEFSGIVEDFRMGAQRAMTAGFDGVEIHSGNGYLFDQFLQDGSNKRTDEYGGPVENRARFLLEATEAVVSVWGGDRVAVRLSPGTKFNDMSDSNPDLTFSYVADRLNRFGLAYLHLIEPRIKGNVAIEDGLPPVATVQLRKVFAGKIIAAGGFEPDTAEAIVEKEDADLVAFGRYFLANPDLPKRIRLGLPLNPYDRETFYGGDARGYTDYPFYDDSCRQPDGRCESKNKAIVLEAFDTLFNKRNYNAALQFWSPGYIQHSAHIPSGRDGLFNLIKSIPPTLKYEPGVIVAEGDFVIIHGRYSGTGLPANWIVADIVRMKEGLLVEHWDVIQDEATKEQSQSGNPMFGGSFPVSS